MKGVLLMEMSVKQMRVGFTDLPVDSWSLSIHPKAQRTVQSIKVLSRNPHGMSRSTMNIAALTRLLTRGETEISGRRLKLVGDDVEPAWPVLSVKLLSLYDKYS